MHKKFIAFTFIFVSTFLLSLSFGSSFTIFDLVHQLASGSDGIDSLELDIFLQLRLPRVLSATIVGLALGSAGVISQGIFRNPLASPSIMGTTSGAGLFVSLVVLSGVQTSGFSIITLAAILGCLTVSVITLIALQRFRLKSVESIVLFGFAINALFGALTTLVLNLSIANPNNTKEIVTWLMGSLQGVQYSNLFIAAAVLILLQAPVLKLVGMLDVYSIGEDAAATKGIHRQTVTVLGVLYLSILVGLSVSVAGPIGFIGLVAPHLTRIIIGPRHVKLYIWSAINGATLLVISDLIARTVIAPVEIQVGVITALIGAPAFIYLLYCNKSHGVS